MPMSTKGSQFSTWCWNVNSPVLSHVKGRTGDFSRLGSKEGVWPAVPGVEQRSHVRPGTYLREHFPQILLLPETRLCSQKARFTAIVCWSDGRRQTLADGCFVILLESECRVSSHWLHMVHVWQWQVSLRNQWLEHRKLEPYDNVHSMNRKLLKACKVICEHLKWHLVLLDES